MKASEFSEFVEKLNQKEDDKSHVTMLTNIDGKDAELKLGFIAHLTVKIPHDSMARMEKKDVLKMVFNNLPNLVTGIMDQIAKIDDLGTRLSKVVK